MSLFSFFKSRSSRQPEEQHELVRCPHCDGDQWVPSFFLFRKSSGGYYYTNIAVGNVTRCASCGEHKILEAEK